MPMLKKEYPFADLISVKAVKPIIEKQFKPPAEYSKTLGDLAEAQLKKLTKRNFGKDPQRWRAWIESHPVAANG